MEQKRLALVAQLPRWPPTMGELWNRTASRGEINDAFHQRFCVLRMNFEMTLILLHISSSNNSEKINHASNITPKAHEWSQSF